MAVLSFRERTGLRRLTNTEHQCSEYLTPRRSLSVRFATPAIPGRSEKLLSESGSRSARGLEPVRRRFGSASVVPFMAEIRTVGRNAGEGFPPSPTVDAAPTLSGSPHGPTLSRHAIAKGGGQVAGGARGASDPDRRGAGRPPAPPPRGAAPGPAHRPHLVDLQHRLLARRRPGLPPLGHDPAALRRRRPARAAVPAPPPDRRPGRPRLAARRRPGARGRAALRPHRLLRLRPGAPGARHRVPAQLRHGHRHGAERPPARRAPRTLPARRRRAPPPGPARAGLRRARRRRPAMSGTPSTTCRA